MFRFTTPTTMTVTSHESSLSERRNERPVKEDNMASFFSTLVVHNKSVPAPKEEEEEEEEVPKKESLQSPSFFSSTWGVDKNKPVPTASEKTKQKESSSFFSSTCGVDPKPPQQETPRPQVTSDKSTESNHDDMTSYLSTLVHQQVPQAYDSFTKASQKHYDPMVQESQGLWNHQKTSTTTNSNGTNKNDDDKKEKKEDLMSVLANVEGLMDYVVDLTLNMEQGKATKGSTPTATNRSHAKNTRKTKNGTSPTTSSQDLLFQLYSMFQERKELFGQIMSIYREKYHTKNNNKNGADTQNQAMTRNRDPQATTTTTKRQKQQPQSPQDRADAALQQFFQALEQETSPEFWKEVQTRTLERLQASQPSSHSKTKNKKTTTTTTKEQKDLKTQTPPTITPTSNSIPSGTVKQPTTASTTETNENKNNKSVSS